MKRPSLPLLATLIAFPSLAAAAPQLTAQQAAAKKPSSAAVTTLQQAKQFAAKGQSDASGIVNLLQLASPKQPNAYVLLTNVQIKTLFQDLSDLQGQLQSLLNLKSQALAAGLYTAASTAQNDTNSAFAVLSQNGTHLENVNQALPLMQDAVKQLGVFSAATVSTP